MMAADAMAGSPETAVNDNAPCRDMTPEFDGDEHGRVWMFWDSECYFIGRKKTVRREMWRFLPGLSLFWNSGSPQLSGGE